MNINSQRGFIPLIAIIAIGITMIVGGTVVTISLTDNKQQKDFNFLIKEQGVGPIATSSTKEVEITHEEDLVASGIKTSSAETQINQEGHSKNVVFSARSKEICNQVYKEEVDRTKKSLILDLYRLCDNLVAGKYLENDLIDAQNNLNNRWEMYLKFVVELREKEFERRSNQTNYE